MLKAHLVLSCFFFVPGLRGDMQVPAQPTVTLNNGLKMPQVGLGTWKTKGDSTVGQAVQAAVRRGYRHIDTAAIYGNEKEIGAALAELFAEGVVRREDLWITSKLWNSMHATDDVRRAIAQTLADLRLSYLDLYLIHWPVTGVAGPTLQPTIEETWKAMEKLVESGQCRAIGVSNFSAKKIEAMLSYAKVVPAVNQVELHPRLRQDGLLKYCADVGVHVTAYSPLGSPDSAAMFKHAGGSVMQHSTVQDVAQQTGKSPAQVLVKWAMLRGTSVIPKSSNADRIVANFDVFDWSLTDAQMAQLSTLEPQERMIDGSFWLNDVGPYKTVADLWDEE